MNRMKKKTNKSVVFVVHVFRMAELLSQKNEQKKKKKLELIESTFPFGDKCNGGGEEEKEIKKANAEEDLCS